MNICDRIPAIKTCSTRDKLCVFVATGAGLGLSPVAPGTVGSLGGILTAWIISLMHPYAVAPTLVFITFLAVLTAEKTAKILRQKDPRLIVFDEIAGMTFALAWLPFTPLNLLIQFLLFRIFDILKPFPVSWAERKLPGGWGIVMDDIAAGIIANLIWRAGDFVYQTW